MPNGLSTSGDAAHAVHPPRRGLTRRGISGVLASLLVVASVGIAGVAVGAPAVTQAPLMVGVGRADVTPPTGHYFQGWVEASAIGKGVNTRIYARAIVLQQDGKKFALVAEDANGISGGILLDAINLDKDLGLTPQNVLDSASHTHAAPNGYSNYDTYNTVFMDTSSTTDVTKQNISGALDPVLYTFEVKQLALALRRANDNLGPGSLGWGSTQLVGLTQNRSLEAHLADFGLNDAYGTGTVSQDPGGYADTIDPDVQLLRVDKTVGGKDLPVGTWETFADHGTVNKATWDFYNADHHGTADRVVEDALRAAGGVPASQDIVSAYGNGDEGDQTAGIQHSGPADAEYVGDVEAQAFLTAWKSAGEAMTSTPTIDSRWTQTLMRSQKTTGPNGTTGETDADAVAGLPLFTGSEEGRGPLYENTGKQNEGVYLGYPAAKIDNAADPDQGDKMQIRLGAPDSIAVPTGQTANVPFSVPILVLQINDRLVASIPGEMTVTMGQRVRAALLPLVSSLGVKHVVLAGLANEYLSYFTTPEEYEQQHYEGGSTMYGEYSSYHILDTLATLSKALAGGAVNPTPDTTDIRNGVVYNPALASGTGASAATPMTQPTTTQRLNQAVFSWQGGAGGLDMPIDSAASPDHPFINIRKQSADGTWGPVTDDLGLQIYWEVDANGVYTAHWEIPLDATLGTYDMNVTANHYTVTSSPFTVTPSLRLVVTAPSAGVLHVGYPTALYNSDITYRPADIAGGTVSGVAIAGTTAAGSSVAAGLALDRYGNCNGAAFGVTGTVTACPALAVAAPAAPTVAGTTAKKSVVKKKVAVAKKTVKKVVAQPKRTLAFTGLPVGIGLLALMSLGLAVAVGRGARRSGSQQ